MYQLSLLLRREYNVITHDVTSNDIIFNVIRVQRVSGDLPKAKELRNNDDNDGSNDYYSDTISNFYSLHLENAAPTL